MLRRVDAIGADANSSCSTKTATPAQLHTPGARLPYSGSSGYSSFVQQFVLLQTRGEPPSQALPASTRTSRSVIAAQPCRNPRRGCTDIIDRPQEL